VSIDVIIPIPTVTAANGWTRRTTNAQSEAEAISAINAMQAVETALTNGQWPANAVADVHMLTGDVAALSGDLQELSMVNLLNDSSWTATLRRDASTLRSAVGLVGAGLGRPATTPVG
jgi:hypothetical protein